MCVASLFRLGFSLCLSIMDLYTSWVCPLLAHGHGSVKPILQGPSGFVFILYNSNSLSHFGHIAKDR